MTTLLIVLTVLGLGYLVYLWAAVFAIIKFDAEWPMPPAPLNFIFGGLLPGIGGFAAVTLVTGSY